MSSLTLLYAEDDPQSRKNYAFVLEEYFSEVYIAEDGREALDLYYEKKPDVLLLDISMPFINGLDVAKTVREKNKNIPIVMLTAHADQEILMHAVNLKLEEYLLKPIDDEKLTQIMKKVIKEIKEPKNNQNELGDLNKSLEERVKVEIDKNKQQQLMMMQQSRLAQMGEVVNLIAHQWKQPLNSLSIIGQTLVLKHMKGNLDAKAINNFNINSKKQIMGMSDTIDDFRDFFKPEKEKKEGTGLGLYMTKLIIEEHMDGEISVENINDGVKFCIMFDTRCITR